jgi:hypothetical protein
MANGQILYRGASMIDGSPIIVIATDSSKNRKTGDMIQTWILRDDINPIDAVSTGADVSICGNCPHRGDGKGKGRSCYVSYFQAPQQVYKTAQKGGYRATDSVDMFAGRFVRFGAYGDPAAVPFEVWARIAAVAAGFTGYTHQWKTADSRFAGICMASCDSESDRIDAIARGFRTFRVRSENDPILTGEMVCPASEEAGKRLKCEECRACAGTRGGKLAAAAAGVTIIVHGSKGHVSNHAKRTELTIGRSAVA